MIIAIFIVLFAVNSPAHAETRLQNLREVFLRVYSNEVQTTYGAQLKIELSQENPQYFGGGTLENDRFTIETGADLLSLKGMTPDAEAFVLCHEMSHLIGGAPKKELHPWASTEGQADYFATTNCLRRIFIQPELQPALAVLDPKIAGLCQHKFSSVTDTQLCARIGTAGENLILAIYDFLGVPQMRKPSIETPAEPLKPGEKIDYPTLQCRLDTVVAGALQEPRPKCWFTGNEN